MATLETHDLEDIGRVEFSRPVGFLPDGRSLVVYLLEFPGPHTDGALLNSVGRYEVVDLRDGSIRHLAKTQNDSGLDFSFGTPSSQAERLVKSAHAKTGGPEPWLEFSPSTDGPPPTDVIGSFTPGDLSGRAVSLGQVVLSGTGDNTQWGTFLTLRRFGGGVKTIQTFPVVARDGYDVFVIGWSPARNRVMLGVGSIGDSTSTYLIHLWNPQTGRIEQGPKERISGAKPRWSPDGARIAYVVGGDVDGENGFLARKATSLHVYDVATGKSRLLKTAVSNSQVKLADARWQNANSLLYATYLWPDSLLKIRSKAARQKALDALDRDAIHPTIFQMTAMGGDSTPVIRHGFRPMPSPDGRWIAFFGWPEFDLNLQNLHSEPRLFVWERATKRRFPVGSGSDFNVQVVWTPDSQKLVLLQSSYKKGDGTTRISTVPVEVP